MKQLILILSVSLISSFSFAMSHMADSKACPHSNPSVQNSLTSNTTAVNSSDIKRPKKAKKSKSSGN